MIERSHYFSGIALAVAAAALGGCIQSALVPMQPIRTEDVVLVAPAGAPAATMGATGPSTMMAGTSSAPATEAATVPATADATATATQAGTESATATAAATLPATAATAPAPRTVQVVVDPNQTTRYVYLGDYNTIWSQAEKLLTDWGYRLDEQDFRRGVLTSLPKDQSQLVEPWQPDGHGLLPAVEASINHQRITLRITISDVPNKPKFYAIAVQALVERESNPSELIGGPIFTGSSAFGSQVLTLRSDYLGLAPAPTYWTIQGRDPRLEKHVLDALFKKI